MYLSFMSVEYMPRQLLYPSMTLLIHLLYLSVSQHSRYLPEIPAFQQLSALRSSY